MDTKKRKKNKKPVKPVVKPFMRGSAVDRGTGKSALMFFGSILLVMLANLLLSAVLVWDSLALRILFNGVLVAAIGLLFLQSGASKGTAAVNQGEIMLQRQEAGREVNLEDRRGCYHPLKGYIIGLLGSVPYLVCCLLLAATAQRVMTGLGALPSWISNLQRREEIGGALAFYSQTTPMQLEDMMRVVVRMLIMPFVNMVGATNADGLLTRERLSVLPMLLPALCYGVGYQQGVRVRTRVHTDIATGKRKRARKAKKQQRARAAKGPEQLN